MMVEKLPGILARRFPNEAKPKLVFTDRGKGYFRPSNGKVTTQYKAALDAAGLKAFQGDDASVQSGELGDCMLHETAVAWLRLLEGQTTPAVPWKESREQFVTRLKAQVQKVNDGHDVDGLCRELPGRLVDLKDLRGGAIKK